MSSRFSLFPYLGPFGATVGSSYGLALWTGEQAGRAPIRHHQQQRHIAKRSKQQHSRHAQKKESGPINGGEKTHKEKSIPDETIKLGRYEPPLRE